MNTPRRIKEAFETMPGSFMSRITALAELNATTPRQIVTCLNYQGACFGGQNRRTPHERDVSERGR